MLSLYHHDEDDLAPVPAAEPAHLPIIDMIAKRDRLAKAKELGLNVHGHLRSTHIHCSLGEDSQPAFRESPEAALLHADQLSANF